jgi:hypothetical protein
MPKARQRRDRIGRPRCGCRLAYRCYAPTPGDLSVPRGETQSTRTRDVRFRALLNEHERDLSLAVV